MFIFHSEEFKNYSKTYWFETYLQFPFRSSWGKWKTTTEILFIRLAHVTDSMWMQNHEYWNQLIPENRKIQNVQIFGCVSFWICVCVHMTFIRSDAVCWFGRKMKSNRKIIYKVSVNEVTVLQQTDALLRSYIEIFCFAFALILLFFSTPSPSRSL